MRAERGIPSRGWGLLIGAGITLAGCLLMSFGWLSSPDRAGLDAHLRYFSSIRADPRIVMIDIDDGSLRTVGDWPWPRRRHAQLISTLHELGADHIVVDLVLSESMAPRVEWANAVPATKTDATRQKLEMRAEDREADVRRSPLDSSLPAARDGHFFRVLDTAGADLPAAVAVIDDDEELRSAIAAAGNVYLAMFSRLAPPGRNPADVEDAAIHLLQWQPGIRLNEFRREIHSIAAAMEFDPDEVHALYRRARLVARLESDFAADEQALVQGLRNEGVPLSANVDQQLIEARRTAARRLAMRFVRASPDADFASFVSTVLPAARPEVQTPERDELWHAIRWARAYAQIASRSPVLDATLSGRIQHAFDLTLPLPAFAAAARGVGLVSFEREISRGVVRAIPLLAESRGVLLPHLGTLVGLDILGLDDESVRHVRRRLLFDGGENRRSLPIDARGRTLIHWHVPKPRERWQASFTHLPAGRVLELALNREAIAHNRRQLDQARAALVRFRHRDTPSEHATYLEQVRRRNELQRMVESASGPPARPTLPDELTRLNEAIAQTEAEALEWLERARRLWANESPANGQERAERDAIEKLHRRFSHGRLAGQIERYNKNLQARIASLADELGPQIAGKTCFIGYTASGLADLVTSPVYSSMPGVMAHANVLNMMLQNRPVVATPPWVNLLLLAGAGLGMTLVAGTRGAATSLMVLLGSMAVLVGAGATLFFLGPTHVATFPAAAELVVIWGAVTGFRQFTEERVRRRLQRALAQYTSPAVAARIAVRAQRRSLDPQPFVVSCFFSDLEGFTTISERLGAARTRALLTPCLEAVSGVLVEHGAIVNKFMGDGVFAFFNAPILPCPRHAEAACAGALASMRALRHQDRSSEAAALHAPLRMRIGVSTGEAFVGDYGSATKLDYTCIGDTVNVGARLENANKFFGTSVLVDEATRGAAGERFIFRTLGLVEVAGKARLVETHELVGLAGELDDDLRHYLSRFEEAIRHYQACRWAQCVEVLEACLQRRPDDLAARRYREAASQHCRQRPAKEWSRAISVPAV